MICLKPFVQQLHDAVAGLRHFVEQGAKRWCVELNCFDRTCGDDGRSPRAMVNQGHFTHHRTRWQRCDVVTTDVYGSRARDQHVTGLANLALIHEFSAARYFHFTAEFCDSGQFFRLKPLKERYTAQIFC